MFVGSSSLKHQSIHITETYYNPFDKLFCPINGFKCPDEHCDCSYFCKGNYEKVTVLPNEEIILYNEKLVPGTYCLPTGGLKCNLKTSVPVFSSNGWVCLSKNISSHFCKHPLSENNNLNILIDQSTGEEASNITDLYEYFNGKLRYQCQCNSTDKKGNAMVALDEVPFTCVPDYCLQNFQNTKTFGWDPVKKICDCKHNKNEMNDPLLPCINIHEGFDNEIEYYGYVKCTHPYSFVEEPIFCAPQEKFFQYHKNITFNSIPMEYLNKTV